MMIKFSSLLIILSFGMCRDYAIANMHKNAKDKEPIIIPCKNGDYLCTAANLSRLYSQGGKISILSCSASDLTCEQNRKSNLIKAAAVYRQYRADAQSRDMDPTFDAQKFDRHSMSFVTELNRFVFAKLLLAQAPCHISNKSCVQARAFIYADVDQAVRMHPNCQKSKNISTCLKNKRQLMTFVDNHTARFVRDTIFRYGWLDATHWGIRTEDDFFLLVQHTDTNQKIQRKALISLKKKVKNKEASREHLSYLTDRIRVHNGLPQLFGTQGRCTLIDGRQSWVPDAIEYPFYLDNRRLSMGMSTFKEYQQQASRDCQQI